MNILRILVLAVLLGPLEVHQTLAQAPTTGLIHQWHFDEASGTTAYDSIGMWNFTLNSGATFFPHGISQSSVSFDGVNDYAETSSQDTTFLNGAYTLSFWELFVSDPGKPGFLNLGARIGLDLDLSIHPILQVSGSRSVTSNYSLDDQNWHLLSIVVNANGARLYFDANLAASTSFKDGPATTGVFTLGGDKVTHYFGGLVDEVSIYNRALSPAEIALAAAVPEPGTALLLATGLGILRLRRRSPSFHQGSTSPADCGA